MGFIISFHRRHFGLFYKSTFRHSIQPRNCETLSPSTNFILQSGCHSIRFAFRKTGTEHFTIKSKWKVLSSYTRSTMYYIYYWIEHIALAYTNISFGFPTFSFPSHERRAWKINIWKLWKQHSIRIHTEHGYIRYIRYKSIDFDAFGCWHWSADFLLLILFICSSEVVVVAHTHMDRATAQRTHFRNCVYKFYASIYLWHFLILQWLGLVQPTVWQKSRTPSAG